MGPGTDVSHSDDVCLAIPPVPHPEPVGALLPTWHCGDGLRTSRAAGRLHAPSAAAPFAWSVGSVRLFSSLN